MFPEKKRKIVRLLHQKKYRQQEGLFLAEGYKCVEDLLAQGAEPEFIVHTGSWQAAPDIQAELYQAGESELAKLSLQATPSGILAVFRQKTYPGSLPAFRSGIRVFLDGLQDPGNLGTIIRSAHWFGISSILLSSDSVEWYNPKTVQSTMGSLLSVPFLYTDREKLPGFKEGGKIFSADMQGTPLAQIPQPENAIIIVGNESRGVSEILKKQSDHFVHIPAANPANCPESLNAAISATLFFYEWKGKL